ncbi:hypothetical protein COT99_03500 [Candidatus Falkowbacteria bacterium CG10_big_fil_rev_8_21_14_0_10_43_10]|uniref:Multidrug ABC transporter substrate-binding protein n=1 Tax=Candidatus Falkowbacteria bacterium CG10_big_fil_rev_8_21_14_0_10_43_10 TaxID=1974567 RepID=A0A2H0V3N1_9BACT|nr:MAG: hypothetical protein COT99_03500 [Candidatus Falkowbacteria bacterium CG10_big_fil_rev_8_21_14_0_10_43_10]
MNLFTPLKIAYKAIRMHKIRSALTVLGLVIGITSIIVVINMGQGIENLILKQVEVFGTDFLEVEIKVPSVSKTSSANAAGIAQGISITTLKLKDAEAVAKQPNISNYYTMLMGQDIVSVGRENKTAMLWGVSPSFFPLFKSQVEFGRPFFAEEDLAQARVAVIGQGIREKLFGERDAVGEYVKIGDKNFHVIGVMEKQSSMMFFDMNSTIFLPIRTLQKQVLGIDHIQAIIAYLKNPNLAAATAADITEIMREQHGITDPKKDDFAVTTMEEALGMLNTVTGAITLLLMAIAGISLLVGGVGIMNIMYVSVKERTYEIGLRKALGATNGNILWQFLWEAIFLTFSGGIIGVILGELLSLAAVLGARAFGLEWGFNFSLSGLALAVGFSVMVGLIFGIYPARQAAQMQPVEALGQQ